MDIKATKHCRYNINYHMVWCPKYRHDVLTGDVDFFLKELISTICKGYGYDLLELEVMPDHIHLFVSTPPYIAPTEIVKTIKSISATSVFRKFKKLKGRKFWGSGLWSKGYYVGTAGTVTVETIRRYIDEQKTRL